MGVVLESWRWWEMGRCWLVREENESGYEVGVDEWEVGLGRGGG